MPSGDGTPRAVFAGLAGFLAALSALPLSGAPCRGVCKGCYSCIPALLGFVAVALVAKSAGRP